MDEKKIIVTLTKEQILLIPGALDFLYKLADSKPIIDFILGREEKKTEESIDESDINLDTL